MRNICDEVLGECNFVACVVWQKIHSIKNDAKYFSENHEYALIYAKSISKIRIHLLPRTDEMNSRYKNPDNDPRGPWQSGDLVASGERSNGHFFVTSPKTGKQFDVPQGISYDAIEGEYDSSIFTAEKATQSFDKAFLAKKAIQDYVFTDGSADKSIERKFAEDLDAADEVCVYAKLPRTFQIPTPVGNYSPDWAIAFYEGKVKHIFFIAETKGTMESLELRPIEQAKISCAKKLFNEMSTSNVVYHDVDSYQSLLNIMNSL